jgi:hypothetical protein
MPHDTGARDGTSMVLLGQLERAEQRLEAERRRNDYLLASYASALARIDQRLTGLEAALTRPIGPASGSLTPAQWLKLLVGLALPLAALMLALSGNIDAARRLMGQ